MRIFKKTTPLLVSVLLASSLCGCGNNHATELTSIKEAISAIKPEALDYEISRTKTVGSSYSAEHVYNNYRNMIYIREGDKQQYLDAADGVLYQKNDGQEEEIAPYYWESLDVDFDNVSQVAFEELKKLIDDNKQEVIVDKDIFGDNAYDMITIRYSSEDALKEISKYEDELIESNVEETEPLAESVLESDIEADELTSVSDITLPKTGADSEVDVESVIEDVKETKNLSEGLVLGEGAYLVKNDHIDIMKYAQPLEMNFVVSKDRKYMEAFGISFLTSKNEVTTVTWNDISSVAQSYRYAMWHNGENVPSLEEEKLTVANEMAQREITYQISLPEKEK